MVRMAPQMKEYRKFELKGWEEICYAKHQPWKVNIVISDIRL